MMMVLRTGGDRGNLEIDIWLKGFGRFRCSAQTMRVGTKTRRVAIAKLLAEIGQFDVLHALKLGPRKGGLAWSTVELAQRQQRLRDDSLGQDLKLAKRLTDAIDATLPRMGKEATTHARYQLGLEHAIALAGLTDAATVKDLKRDWREDLAGWDAPTETKNGARRAVSRFLSRYLGDKHHPFRREVLHEDRWPAYPSPRPRVKGFAVEHFWPLMQHVGELLVPSYVLLAATGMRVGEYLNDDAFTLDEINRQLIVNGKTGEQVYGFAPGVWRYIKAAVPCRVARRASDKPVTKIQEDPRYKKLYNRLHVAGETIGVKATVHDLRRLFARVGVAEVGESQTQSAIGHKTPAMTRDYARWHTQQEVAEAVASALGLGAEMSGEKSGDSKRNKAARGGKR